MIIPQTYPNDVSTPADALGDGQHGPALRPCRSLCRGLKLWESYRDVIGIYLGYDLEK